MSVQQFPRRLGRPGTTFLALLLVLPTPIAPAIITVSGDCTLVDAVTAANSDLAAGSCPAGSGADEIRLTGDVELTVAHNDIDGPNGLPSVTSEINIEGNGFKIERADGPGVPDFRIFHIASNGTLTLSEVVVANGYVQYPYVSGGGLVNHGAVVLVNSTVADNRAAGGHAPGFTPPSPHRRFPDPPARYEGRGGGIENYGTLSLTNATVTANEARLYGQGGGIDNLAGASLTLQGSTVSGNVAYYGAGIWNAGEVTVTNSSFFDNFGDDGAAIASEASATTNVTKSSFFSNRAFFFGGAINNNGTFTLTNSTVSGNSGADGGGIWNSGTSAIITTTNSTLSGNSPSAITGDSGTVVLTNTIVANTGHGYNCYGSITNAGNNLADDTSCGTIPDTLTGLEGQLRDNGGPTMTHALLKGSNARDAGSEPDCPTTDQRGAARVSTCDIGAFEYIPCPDLVLSSEIISATETRENCQQIRVGPYFSVTSSGDLTLRAGKEIRLSPGSAVEADGRLTLEIDPDLQLVPP